MAKRVWTVKKRLGHLKGMSFLLKSAFLPTKNPSLTPPKKKNPEQPQKHCRHNRPQRRGDNSVGRSLGILRQVIHLRFIQQEEERMQATFEDVVIHAVEASLVYTPLV